ncbi:MAG: GFA family protein [Proteobacteria bacterium]|nr:GFA family protein [Pseudomonadota bacterium]
MTKHYQGSCHCGAIKFSYDGEEILKGLRCTCSICSRKGTMMSTEAIPLENLSIEADENNIGLYQFGSKIAKHYFCKICGIYTHNEMLRKPGHMRVNLGCVDDLDTSILGLVVFDGKTLL